MPNTKSAKKELRKSKKNQEYNNKIKDNVKGLFKKSHKAVEAGDKKAADLIKDAFRAIDKAAQKGVIDKNTRNRKKSRLHAKLNKIANK